MLNRFVPNLWESKKSVAEVKDIIADQKTDYLIYNVGVREHHALTEGFDFSKTRTSEIILLNLKK